MRKVAVVLGIVAVWAMWASPVAHAQNVQGLTLRAGEALKGSPSGLVDIVGNGDSATVMLDLSGAAETMKLADFEGAKAFVVWAVDMDGYRHNLGALSDELKLADVEVDYRVARLYVTAEADAGADAPSGDPLYAATLRNVTEKDGAPAGAAKSGAAASSSAAPSAAAASAPASAASTGAAKPAASAKPSELPTTGGGMSDLALVALAAMGLLWTGARLVRVRAS